MNFWSKPIVTLVLAVVFTIIFITADDLTFSPFVIDID